MAAHTTAQAIKANPSRWAALICSRDGADVAELVRRVSIPDSIILL
jgi:hypothetical protein